MAYSKPKVFIDGGEGTTGLRIHERLQNRNDIELLKIDTEFRKDLTERLKMYQEADIVFMCLPDEAVREILSKLSDKTNCCLIDTSTAHRTLWAYGFPELSRNHYETIIKSSKISVPGCHASGFIAMVYPLVTEKIISSNTCISCYSITGYSGGGKKMINEYENNQNSELNAPILYALNQKHKHLPEMTYQSSLVNDPIFNPIVCPYYNGMMVTIHLDGLVINKTLDEIKTFYQTYYQKAKVIKVLDIDNTKRISADSLKDLDSMEIIVSGENHKICVTAVYDNLGKGASGAAIQCMNIKLGFNETEGLMI